MKKNYMQWGGLILFILCEYLLFRNYILREIVPFYPRAYDQSLYLMYSYGLYENIIAKGSLFDVIFNQIPMPQTFLFLRQATIFYLFFGASRLTALSINFIYFAIVQLFSFAYFKKMTGTYLVSFIFIVLLLSTNILNMASDFRIDFIATCLYGIFCCAVLRSDVFLSRNWTMISLAIAIFLFLMRYITGCYIVGVGVLSLVCYFSVFALKSNRHIIAETKARIKNLLIFNLGFLLILVCVFCFNYMSIYNYYIVGHLNGPEKLLHLKDAFFTADISSSAQLFYYPKMFFTVHFPEALLLSVLVMFGIFGLTYQITNRYRKYPTIKRNLNDYKNPLLFLLISIAVPLSILSIDDSKSSIVIGIVIIPFIYLIVFGFVMSVDRVSVLSKITGRYLLIATIVFFALPLPHHFLQLFARERGHTWYDGRTHFDDTDASITKMVNDIGDYASFLHGPNLVASSDRRGDYIFMPVVPLYYEKHHIMFNIYWQKLGGTIFAVSKQEAIDSLNHSNIYFMTLNNYIPDKIYPFESSIQPYRVLLKEMAEKQMIKLGDYTINSTSEKRRLGDYYVDTNSAIPRLADYGYYLNSDSEMLRVFVKPDLYITGGLDNLITDQGIWLNIPAVVAQQIKIIKLFGSGDFRWLKNRNLKVYAEAEIDKKDVPIKADLTVSGNHYQIVCELPEWQSDKALVIHLIFSDSYYDGHHQIVMPMPDKKIFLKS